jgi:hypothetical protein
MSTGACVNTTPPDESREQGLSVTTSGMLPENSTTTVPPGLLNDTLLPSLSTQLGVNVPKPFWIQVDGEAASRSQNHRGELLTLRPSRRQINAAICGNFSRALPDRRAK